MRGLIAISTPSFGRALSALLVVTAAVAAGVLGLVGTRSAEAAFEGDNGQIAFTSTRVTTGNPTGDEEIFAMNPDGTGIEQLTSNSAESDSYPAWSANGGWMAWSSHDGSDSEIYMRNYPFGNLIFLVSLSTNTVYDAAPAFNHDTSKIAFTTDRDAGNYEIYVMDTSDTNPSDGNGDNPTNLTEHPEDDYEPAFNDEGTKIAFVSERDGNAEIYVVDSDGTDPVNLTNNTDADDFEPTWSPDGTKIAFTSERDGNRNIYVMNVLDPTEQKKLTKKTAADYEPAFSPDGKRIAFASNRGGGDSEIYVMKAKPESKKNRPKNLTKNDGVSDYAPDWRPVA